MSTRPTCLSNLWVSPSTVWRFKTSSCWACAKRVCKSCMLVSKTSACTCSHSRLNSQNLKSPYTLVSTRSGVVMLVKQKATCSLTR